MFGSIFKRWKLRTTCSCGTQAVQLDDRNFQCPNGCGCYDGFEEFEQQKLMIEEKDTIMRDL